MTAVWAVLSLLAPWATGCAVVRRWSDAGTPTSLVLGAGWLVGQAGIMTLLYVSFASTGAGHARIALLLMGLLCILVLWSRRRADGRGRWDHATGGDGPHQVESETGQGRPGYEGTARGRPTRSVVAPVLIVLIATSLGLKLLTLAGAHAFVPIRGDDAISIWMFKAKAIATLDHLSFDPAHDYYLGGSTSTYPVFVSLMAAWIPLVCGGWNEQLATLPWLGFYLSLILLVAGGLQRWMSANGAWVIAYLVGSMPLVVIHGYRPGYADLPLAAFLAACILYMLTWRSTGAPRDLGFALAFAAAAACMKREGPALAGVAILTLCIGSSETFRAMSRRALCVVSTGSAAAVLLAGFVLDFSDLATNLRDLSWQPEAFPALVRHLFSWSSFHFAEWMAVAGVAILAAASWGPIRLAVIAYSLAAVGLVAAVFLLTPQARFAINDQTPSRLFLQVLPGVILALAAASGGQRATETRGTRHAERLGS